MGRQDIQKIEFAVVTKDNEAVKIGRAVMHHPPIRYSGNGIKWFDDTRLVKKGGAE